MTTIRGVHSLNMYSAPSATHDDAQQDRVAPGSTKSPPGAQLDLLRTRAARSSASDAPTPAARVSKKAGAVIHRMRPSTKDEQVIVAAGFSPAEAREFGTALRHAHIPVNPGTLADIKRFNDSNLTGEVKPLNPGHASVVLKVTYGDFTGVFRKPANNLWSATLRVAEKSSSPCRDKATYLLDQKLRFGVIPHTAFAIHRNASGKLEAGVVMEFVRGKTAHPTRAETDITATEVGQKLLRNKSKLLKDKVFIDRQCKLLGVDSIMFSDDGKVAVVYRDTAVDFEDSTVKRDLIKLQILDYLAKQLDRNVGNYIVDDGEERSFGIKGIDNDLSFEKNFAPYKWYNQIKKTNRRVGKPEFIDDEMRDAIMSLDADDLKRSFSELLPAVEVNELLYRLERLRNYIGSHPERVINSDKWSDIPFFDEAKSYIARDNKGIADQMKPDIQPV